MLIGAIADDLTGAADLALMLFQGGLRTVVDVGVPEGGAHFDGAQAAVVALKSRTIPPEDAVAQSLASARVLQQRGAGQLYFKYCSTFDSTDRGNIGPVTDALLSLLGEDRTIACPAYPANGRTVYKGHLFVGDVLLSESSMRDHPLTPMRDANLMRVLGRQTDRTVRLVDHGRVRGTGLRAAFEDEPGIAIVDTLSDIDLHAIGAASAGLRLVTGGSGLAMGLAAAAGAPSADPPFTAVPPGPGVVLAGSCSARTRRQIEVAERAGVPGLRLDALEIASGRANLDMVAGFLDKHRDATTLILYTSADPQVVAAAQAEAGSAALGSIVEQFFGEVAAMLVDQGVHRLLVAGGETSGAVVAALGVARLSVGPPIAPGVPWMFAERGGTTLALALKSGNFGADELFLSAWTQLR